MKADLKKELEEIAPFLAENKGKEGLKVPYNYFDHLPDKVLDRIRTEAEQDQVTVNPKAGPAAARSWWQFFWPARPVWTIAGVALLIAAGVYWKFSSAEETVLSELTEADIQQYIQENEEEFSEELILETLTDDKSEVSIEASGIEQKDIEKYLEELDPDEIEDLL